jgi:hypothetical protein
MHSLFYFFFCVDCRAVRGPVFLAARLSGAKVKCDYAIGKLFSNRIFNRMAESPGNPLFIGERKNKKNVRPNALHRSIALLNRIPLFIGHRFLRRLWLLIIISCC